jgi:hypothetical protein
MEKFYPTKAGIEYAALTAQGKIIEFTKGKFGDGVRSTENITELTDLIHPLGELPISKKSVKNSTIITTTQFSNRVGGSILPTFYLMEIGLFAKVVNADGTDDDEHPETLIGYAFDGHGDKIIGTSLSEFIINIPLTVADVNNVTVDIDSLVYPTLKQFEDEVNTRKTEDEELQNSLNVHITDTSNPHGVTAEQIGLDKVPNVATNDQTPTYSQNSTLSNIVSGEKISVSFGKIMKAIADLISHIGSKSNPHSVTKSQVGLDNVPNVATNDQQPTFAESGTRSNIVSGETLSTLFGKIKKFFADLKTVAFTGSYTDLSNKPTSMQNPNSLTLTMNGSATNYNGASSASKSWYAPTSAGTAGYNLISNGSGAPVWQQPPYAVCNTSGSTVAKTVSITNFKLVTGVRVFIKFTYAHDSRTKATLNVNNTGAKSIRYKGYGVFKGYNGGGSNSTDKQYPNTWEAGEIVEFIYDGTEWVSILEKRKIDHSNIVVGTINVDGYRIPPSINDVDFMCGIDGKSDVEVIQEAINASRNGSRIILKKGNYSIDAPIYMYGGNHADKLFGEQATDVPKLNFSNNGIITSRSSSSDSKLYYSLYFENISMELTPQLCIEGASIYFDNVYSRLDVTTAQNLGSTPIKSSGLFKVKNGSDIDFWIRSSSSYICYCGIDCTTIEVDDSSISLQNECSSTQGAGGDDLNFIYNTNAKGYIRNSKLTGQGNGRTNFINGQVTIDECDITLKNSNHSLCHYTTNAERKLCSLRDCTINYTASTYLTFGKIEGCFFINTVTAVSSSENNKLQILCPTQMIGNTFIGRSEMNFNSNKVQFIGNAMQYSQSYTSFPTGSVNTGTMITG